jgi:hypothetical protein
LTFFFHLKFILNLKFFKMSSVWVHFSPGFPLGGEFPAEQNTHVVLCMNRILPEQNRFPEVLCVFLIPVPPEQKPDSLLSRKFPSQRKSNTAGAVLPGTPSSKLQRASRTLQGQPLLSSCGLLPPRWSKLLCRKSRAKAHPDGRHFKQIRSKNEF